MLLSCSPIKRLLFRDILRLRIIFATTRGSALIHETTRIPKKRIRASKMMGMYFHFGVAETILFSVWKTTDWQGILASMIGIILLAAIYEGLKNYREHLYMETVISRRDENKKRSRREMMFSGMHFYQTVLHMIQFIIGYFLMFIFMTYNVWLALATVIGTGFGYWLFSWNKFTSEDNDCCS